MGRKENGQSPEINRAKIAKAAAENWTPGIYGFQENFSQYRSLMRNPLSRIS